jgi:hypothetical protein
MVLNNTRSANTMLLGRSIGIQLVPIPSSFPHQSHYHQTVCYYQYHSLAMHSSPDPRLLKLSTNPTPPLLPRPVPPTQIETERKSAYLCVVALHL